LLGPIVWGAGVENRPEEGQKEWPEVYVPC